MKTQNTNTNENETLKLSAAHEKKALSFFSPSMILSFLPALLPFLPMIIIGFASKLKGETTDPKSAKAVLANVLIALAPVVGTINSASDVSVRKVIEDIFSVLGNYLGKTPAA